MPIQQGIKCCHNVITLTRFYHFKCSASGEIKSKKFFLWDHYYGIKSLIKSLIFTSYECNSAKIYQFEVQYKFEVQYVHVLLYSATTKESRTFDFLRFCEYLLN